MESKKNILVIGGGFSGLASIKSLKEEGIDPVCYEKTSQPGGLWYYREDSIVGVPSIMPSTAINHSKEMGTFTNFVPDRRYPNYMRHQDLLQLFKDIGNKFDCFRHIAYNREVLKVKRSEDYEHTGRWTVDTQNTETGEVLNEVFDGVIVCIGLNTHPKMPFFPGLEGYKGRIMHTHMLKEVEEFKRKTVVVVGIGCSALDAAVEISNVASQVYLSTRSGAWVVPRVGPFGLPFDYAMLRRFGALLQSWFGYKFNSWYYEKYFVNQRFNHSLYNLKPRHPALSRDPITNDILPAKLMTGAVKVRKDVQCFTDSGVIFENDSWVTEADAVVFATGYEWKFPFLEEGTVQVEDGAIQLYKCMYPPHLKHQSLAMIGFFLPNGPGFPIGEMQSRWAAQVFNGKFLPPCEEEMRADIKKRHEENFSRYIPSDKTTVRVDYMQYLDELASQFGAKPSLWKLFFTDLKLYSALMFGPSLPYQYRLQGPHKWDGARRAIFTAYGRVRYPFTEEEPAKNEKARKLSSWQLLRYLLTFMLLANWFSQTEITLKCYILALLLPYIISWKAFYQKYFVCAFLLPFYITWDGFLLSYLVTFFFPMLLATLNC